MVNMQGLTLEGSIFQRVGALTAKDLRPSTSIGLM